MSSLILMWSTLLLAFPPALALHVSQLPFAPVAIHDSKTMELFHIRPREKEVCIEGEEAYLQEALTRLQASNMKTGWLPSNVEQGTCASIGYKDGPISEHCFPKAAMWGDGRVNHEHEGMDVKYVLEGNAYNADGHHDAFPKIDCMYEVPESKSSKATHRIIPRTGWLCMQGPLAYVSLSLDTLQKSNMQTGWNSTEVEKGSCTEVGYTETAPYFAGAQQLLQFCMPKLVMYIDPIQDTDQLKAMDMLFVAEFNQHHPESLDIHQPVIECMDRIGSIF